MNGRHGAPVRTRHAPNPTRSHFNHGASSSSRERAGNTRKKKPNNPGAIIRSVRRYAVMKPRKAGDTPAATGFIRLMKPQNMSAITQALRSCRR